MIYLIDGSHLLHRIRHTEQAKLTSKSGEPSGLVHGFLRSLSKIRRDSGNTAKLVVAWDKSSSEFRTNLFHAYKAGRYSNFTDEDRRKLAEYNRGRQLCIDILSTLKIPTLSLHGIEADDIIGFLSLIDYGEHKIIYSDDKDLLQLAKDDTDVYRPRLKKKISREDVIKEWDLDPENFRKHFIMIRAMVGDKSDCIPGIKGIGQKTGTVIARKVLNGEELGDSAKEKAFLTKDNQHIFERNIKLMDIYYALSNSDMPSVMRKQFAQIDMVDSVEQNFMDLMIEFNKLELKQCAEEALTYLVGSGLERILPER